MNCIFASIYLLGCFIFFYCKYLIHFSFNRASTYLTRVFDFFILKNFNQFLFLSREHISDEDIDFYLKKINPFLFQFREHMSDRNI